MPSKYHSIKEKRHRDAKKYFPLREHNSKMTSISFLFSTQEWKHFGFLSTLLRPIQMFSTNIFCFLFTHHPSSSGFSFSPYTAINSSTRENAQSYQMRTGTDILTVHKHKWLGEVQHCRESGHWIPRCALSASMMIMLMTGKRKNSLIFFIRSSRSLRLLLYYIPLYHYI